MLAMVRREKREGKREGIHHYLFSRDLLGMGENIELQEEYTESHAENMERQRDTL